MMGVTGIIVLHTLRRGEPELSPSLEDESSSLGDSSRMACNDIDSLRDMPSNTASESAPLWRPTQVVGAVGQRLEQA
jgi:hypothetical protein